MTTDPDSFDPLHHHHLARLLHSTAIAADEALSDVARAQARLDVHLGAADDEADAYALDFLDNHDLHRAMDDAVRAVRTIARIASTHVQHLSDMLVPDPPPATEARYWCPRCQADADEIDRSRSEPGVHPRCGQPVRLIGRAGQAPDSAASLADTVAEAVAIVTDPGRPHLRPVPDLE